MRNRENLSDIGGDVAKIGLGVGAIEYGPDIVKNAMGDVINNSDFAQNFSQTKIGEIGEKVLDGVQGAAPVIGAGFLTLKALEVMWENANLPGQEQAR